MHSLNFSQFQSKVNSKNDAVTLILCIRNFFFKLFIRFHTVSTGFQYSFNSFTSCYDFDNFIFYIPQLGNKNLASQIVIY